MCVELIFVFPFHTRVAVVYVSKPRGVGTNQILIRGGSAQRSNPLPFYIPFWQKRYPFYIPFIEKKVPLSHAYFRKSCSHFHVVLNK